MVAVLAVVVPVLAVWVRTDPDADVRIERLPFGVHRPARYWWERRLTGDEYAGGWTTTKAGARREAARAGRR